MSYETERYSIEKLPDQSLAVIECGLQICHSGHSSGRLTYRHYAIHFILDGKGTYFVGDNKYELQAGEGFLITPDVPNVYIADKDEPWKYIYATFYGFDAEAIVHNSGLDENNVVFTFPLDNSMISDLKMMHYAVKSNAAMGYDVVGYFLLVMSRLIKNYKQNQSFAYNPEHYIRKSIKYIEDHYPYKFSVSEMAKYLNIDRTYLYRIFKKHLGISPNEYLCEHRLRKAVELMENNSLSVSEIAGSVGFYDISHFSKSFKLKFGVNPGEYRKKEFGI